ncbi:protein BRASSINAZOLE-RESISTANT 1 [Prunus yedoensis var. nudiflora]|uniref:Protein BRASSINAZOLE-RESISTANT 1 n=1 Tax=Prunus yedoensis var. nudiflora TaxID=2094558 RepID=A0A314USE4_PRUYE|nr:protein BRASSINAZOLE-RESISTANT 1 [Prunus yedoensis var. nudiflora]
MPALPTFNLVKPIVAHQNLPDSEIPEVKPWIGEKIHESIPPALLLVFCSSPLIPS